MRILVVSNTPWNDNNSFGLSFSNIFQGIADLEFANIYCSTGTPNNEFHMECFQITVKSLIQNLRNKNKPSGKVVENRSDQGVGRSNREQQGFDKVRTMRWQVMFWGRDIIWKVGRWKSSQLCDFIGSFDPDIIFQPVYFSSHLNDIAQFLKEYTGVPMIGYISDDNYTLRQFHFSPLYWVDRLWKRQKVKKTINMCELLYVISDIQKEEYEVIFSPPCKILTKCADFSGSAPEWETGQPIKLVYAGNVSAGRYQSLKLIADVVAVLNDENYNVELHIYTSSPLTDKMKNSLGDSKGIFLYSAIPYTELLEIQKSSDIMVHVEGLSRKERFAVHQSFSTKLVDYFMLGKCIFAIGTADMASIKHLLDNDAAVVAKNGDEVYLKLKALLDKPETMSEYGQKAYECGRNYHDKKKIQYMVAEDLEKVKYQ